MVFGLRGCGLMGETDLAKYKKESRLVREFLVEFVSGEKGMPNSQARLRACRATELVDSVYFLFGFLVYVVFNCR